MTHDNALEAAARALCDPDKCVAANEPDRSRCTAENCNSVIAAQKAITAYLSAMAGEHGELVERANAAQRHLAEAGVMSATDASALLGDLAAALAAADAEIERLMRERDAAVIRANNLVMARDAAEAKVAELLAALEPFAKCSETYPRALPSLEMGFGALHDPRCPLTAGDFHRARAAAIRAREE